MFRANFGLFFICSALLAQQPPGPTPQLMNASNHPMQYYVSLPVGWSSSRAWPVVVTIEGAGQNWAGNAAGFASARKNMPFIIVTPLVLTDGSHPNPEKYRYSQSVWDRVRTAEDRFKFDHEGINAVVRDVVRKYSGQPKFFITGFSAGGHTAWYMILTHPEELAGAALAAGNYLGRGISQVSSAPERLRLPVKGFQGDRDPYREAMTSQFQNARALAESHGYRSVDFQVIPGVGHSAMPDQVLAFFMGLTGK